MITDLLRRARNVSAPYFSARFTGALLGFAALLGTSAHALTEAPAAVPQITQQVDNASRAKLTGSVHPLAQARYDRGVADASLQAPRIQLMLKRPADREAALKQFIADVHTKGTASYHKWLTPDQFGKQFGPADSDVATVTAWLQSQGLTVNKVSRGKSLIEFGGTTAQVQSAFGTSIHKYVVNGETHYANATPATIPSALAPAIKGLVSLNNFKMKSQAKVLGTGTYNPKTHKGTGSWTYGSSNGGEFFFVAPSDFAVEYDTAPLVSAGTNGSGVTIGIINDSNIDVALVNAYRSLFSLPASTPQVIVDGNDPGVNSDSIEAYLDVEQAGAVAPGATIALYVGESTSLSAGLDLATARAVDDDTAQILNLSFGNCEQYLQENTFYAYEWEQAAAQGQTVTVSSGDAGSEQCSIDTDNAGNTVYGVAVNGAASTPFNVAVGGTDFYYSDYATTPANGAPASFTNYWDPTATTTPTTSILQYIPEQPWDNSKYGLNISTYGGGSAATSPEGGGGGVSACSEQDSNGNCTGGYALPAFQSSVVPTGTVTRALPDVSLFAANGYNYSSYVICANPGDCNSDGQSASPATVTGVGGTSASSPAFAGIMAMVVQKYGAQGQADYVLYPLAHQFPAAFHDVTAGSNNEPCDPNGDLLSPCTLDATGGTYSVQEYPTATGYDLASGLGSVDAATLVADWNQVTFTATTTTLTVSPSSITHGAAVTLTANVASTSATGDVAFTTTAPLPNNKGLGFQSLTNGVATATLPSSTVANLPGGTYNITAQYEGDGTYAPSTSTAQSITVNPEASTLYLNAFDYYTGSVITTGTTTVPYGTSIEIEAQPVASGITQTNPTVGSLSSNGAATGSVAFTDSGTTANVPLNASGIAAWNPGTFAVGSHSVSASYAGDASFQAPTAPAPVTFTVVKGTPGVIVQPFFNGLQSGSGLTVQVILCNTEGTSCGLGAGTAPTGTVIVTAGSLTQTVTLSALTTGSGFGGVATVGAGNYSVGTATFTNIPAGIATITAAYQGDGNWNAATGNATFSSAAGSLTASTTTLTATPATGTNNASAISLSAMVTGSGPAPTGTVEIVYNDTLLCTVSPLSSGSTCYSNGGVGYATTVTVSGSSVVVNVTFPGYVVNGGTNQFVAAYSGDTTYSGSISAAASASVDQSDFTLSTQNAAVSVASGSSGTATLNLNSLGNFNAAVNLTCSTSTAAITCSVPANVTVNGAATAAVTINVAANSGAMHDPLKQFWIAGGSLTLACLVFFGIPARQRGWRSLIGLVLAIVFTANFGCGGSSHSSTPPATVATPTFSPAAGTYTSAQTVTISDSTTGAAIFYTTDGSTPTSSSTKYTSAITVSTSETINAIATASGETTSAVATAAYTISATPPPASGTNPVIHNITIQVYNPSGGLLGTVTVTAAVATGA